MSTGSLAADARTEIVTDCSSLLTGLSLWMLGMVGVLFYYGMGRTNGVVVKADKQCLTSVKEGELSSSVLFCCRSVYADRIAERVE